MSTAETNGFHIRITGQVQGVGFRPFVWRVANELSLCGHIFNDGEGVLIEVLGDENAITHFTDTIRREAPPLSRIDSITLTPVFIDSAPTSFSITESVSSNVKTGCPPDAATCEDCRNELFDPADRRYQYPFLNCTNCGPRLSIIKTLPYDRASTTMVDFPLCEACAAEYQNPADRRFHAQPVACPDCGPTLWLEDNQGEKLVSSLPFTDIAMALADGKIVALKGLGGFHLVCDATNDTAVNTLRKRKCRPHKAFALMMKDTEHARQYVLLGEEEMALLTSPQAPVVLAPPCDDSAGATAPSGSQRTDKLSGWPLAKSIAPDTNRLGIMLPYTPIHLLLMDAVDFPLVMTSGNASGQPQAIDNEDARSQLCDIADVFVMHNRPIHNRVDDSVMQVLPNETGSRLQPLRLARGYAPLVLPLPEGFSTEHTILALGAELKNTFCMTQGSNAVISQHMGDLSDARTFDAWEQTLALYRDLYQFSPSQICCDLHPDYLSSGYARRCADEEDSPFRVDSPVSQIQHHHAHMAACMGDNGVPLSSENLLGICLDGTGLGTDGTLWGGEVLFGNYQQAERLGGLKPAPLPGGTQAILAPWRCLFGQLYSLLSEQDIRERVNAIPGLSKTLVSPTAATLAKMIDKQLNCPLSSSAGRLFDAVAALLGCYDNQISYEGQAAVALQKLAENGLLPAKPFTLKPDTEGHIDPGPMLLEMIDALEQGEDKANIAKGFHVSMAASFTCLAQNIQKQKHFRTVVLSGGVMQNSLLQGLLQQQLQQAGFTVLSHRRIPANDAGIAFGQALITLARTTPA